VSTNGNSVSVTTTDTASTAARLNSVLLDPDNGTANARCFIWQNGTQSATLNAATGVPFVENASSAYAMFSASTGGFNSYDGLIGEIVIWSGDRSANRAVWEASAKAFWGTP
jgi:hypothetical protein